MNITYEQAKRFAHQFMIHPTPKSFGMSLVEHKAKVRGGWKR